MWQPLIIKVEILKRTYDVAVNIGAPQVTYCEKITRPVTVDYTHKKQTGGSGQFARVKIVAEPLPPGTGFLFENKIVNANVIGAMVPLANMFGYVNTLRSLSQGRATVTMQFDRCAPTPAPDGDPRFRPAVGMRA